MILEQAILNVLPDQTAQFELAFEQTQQIIFHSLKLNTIPESFKY